MSADRHHRPAPLTLVAPPEGEQKAGVDWSGLMKRAQDGDRLAYRTLLEDIAPYVRSLAARCFKQQSDVEDAVQDVLLTLHMVRHVYDPRRPFGPWLVAIANRRIIDRLRRDTRQKTREIEFSAEYETLAGSAANLDTVLPDKAALGDAIEKLPDEQREAIRMLKLNEMSLKEAAAVSGRSVGALKVATHRAIRTLRQLLRQQGERP